MASMEVATFTNKCRRCVHWQLLRTDFKHSVAGKPYRVFYCDALPVNICMKEQDRKEHCGGKFFEHK